MQHGADLSGCQVWEVVGGTSKGGIVVRRGRSTASEAFDARLRPGARLGQLEIAGGRLRYRLLDGTGPREGWVTTRLGATDLAVRVPAALAARGGGEDGRAPAAASGAAEGCAAPAGPSLRPSGACEAAPGDLAAAGAPADPPGLATREAAPSDSGGTASGESAPEEPSLGGWELLDPPGAEGGEEPGPGGGEGRPGAEDGGGLEGGARAERPAQEGGCAAAPAPGPEALGDELVAAARLFEPPGVERPVPGAVVAGPGEASEAWLAEARRWLTNLNPAAQLPASVRLPAAAPGWEPQAAVLSALTLGEFSLDAGPGRASERAARPGLVSVVCATSDRRRSFHPLVYECFAAQTHEARELVVVHTGDAPSEFFQRVARDDHRVVYRFFPTGQEAPGSPRLSDEHQDDPWQAVLRGDRVEELAMWEWGADPWTYRIAREGWTKSLKRNVGACLASGWAIAHFDDGCLYAPRYLGEMLAELARVAGGEEAGQPAAVALARWYTFSVKEQEFNAVDLNQREPLWSEFGMIPSATQSVDQLNHGFAHVYTRSAWRRQPLPDIETAGAGDSSFLQALRACGAQVSLVAPPLAECLAACGWHRDATCGSVDAAANINYSQALSFLATRGQPVSTTPQLFKQFLPSVRKVAADMAARRDRCLQRVVSEHGPVYVCAYCNFAVALAKHEQGTEEVSALMRVTDGVSVMQTWSAERMRFDCGYFSAAGGAVAEGSHESIEPGHDRLRGLIRRMAICRNCGWQLGWRHEPEENAAPWQAYDRQYQESGRRCEESLKQLRGPVTWSLIWRHLRIRREPGEHVPDDGGGGASRHAETQHNRGRGDVCPLGHQLRRFCTGQGNGGAPAVFYTCDLCDEDARWSQHWYGCGSCDYDVCEECLRRRCGLGSAQ